MRISITCLRPSFRCFVLFSVAMTSPVALGQDAELARFIHQTLDRFEFTKEHREELLKLGKKAHPVFLKILKDEKSENISVIRILRTIAVSKEDRTEFLEAAVARLNDGYWGTRMVAADLIGEIGSAKDAPPLVALLNDAESGTAGSAALALGKIGGRRELLALTIWLKNSDRSDPATVKDVTKAIEQIKKRVEKK